MAIMNAQLIGAGNAAERILTGAVGAAQGGVVLTAGTITIPANRVVRITNLVLTYRGAGVLRLRQTNLAGLIILEVRIAGDGTIIVDRVESPIQVVANAAAAVVVATEEGAFVNSVFLSGKIDG
ncbi:MAG: hypothetical protein ACREDF_09480 [Thermoplasmata archaeon]